MEQFKPTESIYKRFFLTSSHNQMNGRSLAMRISSNTIYKFIEFQWRVIPLYGVFLKNAGCSVVQIFTAKISYPSRLGL